jgi:N-acylneuraminate cytidylyltransferase
VIGERKVLALIPARGGSKELPGKNILRVNGRPLLDWSVAAARGSRYIDRIVLSSEDEAIMAAAHECGCEVPFRRPTELASDTAATIDVVMHALDVLPEYDIVVLLQPTSPLRIADDIDGTLERLVLHNASSCVSVAEAEQSPYWMYLLDDAQILRPIVDVPPDVVRRQDLPTAYLLNGAVYAADTARLRATRKLVNPDTVAFVMPQERSLDIDTAADFKTFSRIVLDQAAGG